MDPTSTWQKLLRAFRPSAMKYGHEANETLEQEEKEPPHKEEDEEVRQAMRKPSERGSYGQRGGLR